MATSRQQDLQPNAPSDDLALVTAAKRGDVSAFNQLVVTYQDLAFNVALRLVGDGESAADVTQDAFLSAYRHLEQFRVGSFRSWLLRIVTNASYDTLRARRRHETSSLDTLVDETGFDPPDAAPLPEMTALRQEVFACIEDGLRELSDSQRAVVVLYDVHGLSYEEVAMVLTISLGTVKSRLSRARSRLRDYLVRHRELWQP